MGLGAVLLWRRDVLGSGGVYGGNGADLEALSAAVGDYAGELGAEVGLREPAFGFGPLLLGHADAGLGLIASLFCTFCAAARIQDGVAVGLGEVGPRGCSGGVTGQRRGMRSFGRLGALLRTLVSWDGRETGARGEP